MNKKRLLTLILVGALLGILVTACAAPAPAPAPVPAPAPAPVPAPAPAPVPAPAPAPVPAPAPAPAQPPKVITWKFQAHVPSGHFWWPGIEELSNRIARSSGGRLVVKPYSAGAIVPAAKGFDGVHGGLLEGATEAINYWKDKFPASTLFTYQVGGLIPIESMMWWDIGGGKELAHRMIKDYDVMVFRGFITPPEVFLQSTKPLESVADFKGLKVRASGDGAEVMARMGASPIFLPGGEIYEAMQRKVIDATEISSPALDWSTAIYEVAKYMYLSPVRQPTDWSVLIFKKSAFAALPDDLKAILEAETGAITPWYHAWLWQKDVEALQKFKAYGTKIAPVSKEIENEMLRQAEIFYGEKTAKDLFSLEVYQSILKFKDTFRKVWPAL